MKKLLIFLIFSLNLILNASDLDTTDTTDSQFVGPLQDLHNDLEVRIIGLKRLGLFFCLYTFDEQNSYLRDILSNYIALSIDAGFMENGEKLQKYISNLIKNSKKTKDFRFTPSYEKSDLKGEHPIYTGACLNLYDSKEYITEIHNLIKPKFTKNTTYTQKYKEIYNSVMSQYCKECRI